MEKSEIDIAVLFVFFVRPETTKQVFDAIKKARPSKLYLYQDGAREGRIDDVENVNKCREIVSDIDWDCEVYYQYQDKNFGCDPSMYIAEKWMFENEEYGIVLEDDVVPSQSFFQYCKEVLEKYKDDERMGIVFGMNQLGEYGNKKDGDYFFTKSGAIWGWATWKRNIDLWDENYSWFYDESAHRMLKNSLSHRDYKYFTNIVAKHVKTGKPHHETVMASFLFLQNKLNIVPRLNMISNVGIGANGTHATDDLKKVPKELRKIFYMKKNEISFPLIHPKYVTEDINFKNKIDKLLANGYPLIKFSRDLESLFYKIRYGSFAEIIHGAKRRLKYTNS